MEQQEMTQNLKVTDMPTLPICAGVSRFSSSIFSPARFLKSCKNSRLGYLSLTYQRLAFRQVSKMIMSYVYHRT